ncbi:hypothetical protein FKW77_006273 [Venturia effusa]|uniref:AB hydrolase-1 domain-containing protein n=1 Tax=Venturia effusa TaxID=50376 RepID=A0A517LHJ0_9PEZI|nr:hypothetical protein FKW77_006273 [Venturia effusa]
MASSSATSSEQPIPLSYTTHTPPHPTTTTTTPIIFLHGLETSSLEYTHVLPFLTENYTIHLIDLPGHSTSKHIPFTLPTAIAGLKHHITTKTPQQKAHLVGLSLGGFIALKFCQGHPEMVTSLFSTGCAPFSRGGVRKWIMEHPSLLANFQLGINRYLPISESMFWAPMGVAPFPELREVMRANSSYDLLVAGYSACNSVSLEDLEGIGGVRVAIVAGARRDDVEGTREAGRVLRRVNEESRAFVVREAVHLWDLQFPELFAEGVRAWVEGREMPKEFEVLE